MEESEVLVTRARNAYESIIDTNEKIVRRLTIMVIMIIIALAAVLSYVAINTANIRSDQVHNTNLTQQIASCQNKALNVIITDIDNLLAKDKNSKDYGSPVRCP